MLPDGRPAQKMLPDWKASLGNVTSFKASITCPEKKASTVIVTILKADIDWMPVHDNGLVQDCGISCANARQSCTKASIKCNQKQGAYELLNLRALKFSPMDKIYIFQCMGKIFWVEFQRLPLKFHTKYLTHTMKYVISTKHRNFRSS